MRLYFLQTSQSTDRDRPHPPATARARPRPTASARARPRPTAQDRVRPRPPATTASARARPRPTAPDRVRPRPTDHFRVSLRPVVYSVLCSSFSGKNLNPNLDVCMFLAESIPLDVGPHTCPCPCRKHLLPTLLHLPPLPRFHVCAHSSWSFPFLCLLTRMSPLPQEPAPGSPRRAAGAAAVARAAKAAFEAAAAGVQAANVVAHIYNKEAERAQSEVGVMVPPVLPPPLPQVTPPPTHTPCFLICGI